ncbi:hypothetical protein IQ06DRAFT_293455 [Phaeosphaeriaceae sp. SRC1lsM3a]|nr:hypothetical protein IQ06DRAFT_293455 [Stagonospora sp. SRC1lsM3a]
MSLCSQTIRAISRSRGPRPNTLLPFLYQTATIQQWKSATRPHARRNVYSRAKPADEIPFEDADGNLPPAVEEAQPTRKTTITDTERAAFEKLYKTFKARDHGGKEKGEHEELDQIADEYYEDDEEQKHTPLDKVFEELLYGKAQSKPGEVDRLKLAAKSVAFKNAATVPITGAESPQKKKQLAAKAEKERIKKFRYEERERIDRLLKNASTDRELWQILDREVFEQLRKLHLDEPSTSQKAKDRSKPLSNDPSKARTKRPAPPPKSLSATPEAQTLFANYPHHLVTALHALRIHFPRSPLPHSLLPTIKALGRSSYALGATTQLYKHLIRTAWVQHSSYSLIDKLLSDMEANIVEFDMGILEVLDGVIREYDLARAGRLGRELLMVSGMETWGEGIEKMREWRGVVAGRLGVREEKVVGVRRPLREARVGDRSEKGSGRENRRNRVRDEGFRRFEVAEDVPFEKGVVAEIGPMQGTAEREHRSFDVVDEESSQLEWSAEPTREEEGGDGPAKVLL